MTDLILTAGVQLTTQFRSLPFGVTPNQVSPAQYTSFQFNTITGGAAFGDETIANYPAALSYGYQADLQQESFPHTITCDVNTHDGQYKVAVFYTYTISNPYSGPAQYSLRYDGVVYAKAPAPPPSLVAAMALNEDLHRRPLAVVPGTASAPGVRGDVSRDAGHSFLSSFISQASGADNPSLLVDRRSNHYHIPLSIGAGTSQSLLLASGVLDDAYTQASAASAISSLSGGYPVAAQHPTDQDYALMVYSDIAGGNTLKAARSLDAGKTWSFLSVIAPGVDLSTAGRPALCWLESRAFLVYASGGSLLWSSSLDRGLTWSTAASVASAGPYSSLSLLGWQGRLYLLSYSGSAFALLTSGDNGLHWLPAPGTLPAVSPPSGIGVIAETGQYRLGITHHSGDAQTWTAN